MQLTVIIGEEVDSSSYRIIIEQLQELKNYQFPKERLLFPETEKSPIRQIKITRSFIARINQFKCSGIIITHSPYVLCTINNCLQAYQASLKNKSAVLKIMKERSWLNFANLRAFELVDDRLVSILNNDSQLIDVNHLDRASEILAEEFDLLLDLD